MSNMNKSYEDNKISENLSQKVRDALEEDSELLGALGNVVGVDKAHFQVMKALRDILKSDFEWWWYNEGSGIGVTPGHDYEEHAYVVAKAAWQKAFESTGTRGDTLREVKVVLGHLCLDSHEDSRVMMALNAMEGMGK
jgi:hypothetical protein